MEKIVHRPNILILYTDQQRWDAVGVNGNPDIQTPNLDRLATEGVNFDHYFVQNPVCMPSRVSFLTGQYPSTLGITHMGVPVPEETVTLPHMLKPYGYRRANIGKLHFLPHANRDHRVPYPTYGFDHLEIADEPGPYEDAYRAWVRRKAPDQLDHISVGLPPTAYTWQQVMRLRDNIRHPFDGQGRSDFKGAVPFPGSDEVTFSAFVAEQTMTFLEQQQAGQPFLCIAGFYSPHAPWVVPQKYLDMYDPATFRLPTFPPEIEARRSEDHFSEAELRSARHGYYAMVTEVDDYVGQILTKLEEKGLAENTLVIFTSDHGEWLGEHLRYGKGYPGADVVSRVPLLMRPPGGASQPGKASQIVEAVDVVPTILATAGIQIPSQVQGESLSAALQGVDFAGKQGALMEHHGWKTFRTRDYRYLIHDDGRESLWNLADDPGEYLDLAADPAYASILAAHRRHLLHRLLHMERPLPRTWTY